MSENNNELIKDYKTDLLQKEYQKYSSYFFAFQDHIERCYVEHIITISERNNLLKTLNDILRQLNTTYNSKMIEICDVDYPSMNENHIKNYHEIHELVNIHKTIGIDTNHPNYDYKAHDNPFDTVDTAIINKLSSKIGFPSVSTALNIIIGDRHRYLFDSEVLAMILLLDNIFRILSYNCETIGDKRSLFARKIDINKEAVICRAASICIQRCTPNIYIILSGFFIDDSLNIVIRTSQICNSFIYLKKKELENHILSKKEISDRFVRNYIRNTPICDVLIMSKEEFLEQLDTDYKYYNKLIKLPFMTLMKEFVKIKEEDTNVCIRNMFNIIKLLLLGSDESVNVAGLLFGISKEKKTDNESIIADIIYSNLSYVLQIKLRKTTVNLKKELDRIKLMSIDDVDLKKQIIICKNMPDLVKKAALEKVEEMKNANNEYYKQLMYVRTLLSYPWPSESDDTFFTDIGKTKEKSKEFLNNVITQLDSRVYGHVECKETIKELIGKWICNPSSSGSAIGLSGPPGVGKTLLAKAIGESLGIPFVQITLGGQNDGELLHGHGYTYSGSQPGMIIKKMVEAASARCIMYFDELDKACKRYDSNEIYNILIHITDPNTNTEFQDRFFQEIKFSLNKVLFIFSYNESTLIDSILMDRIKEIEVKPFKLQDKKIIIDKFLVKEMCELVGFEKDSITFTESAIDFIINQYTNEPGVRELKRKFEKIFLKLNIDRIYNTNIFEKINNLSSTKPLTINKEAIGHYLGKNTIHIQYIHSENIVGVINGLYATDGGQGGILPIQVYDNYTNGDDKFTLKLTGSQRRIMRESVISAFTSAIHCIREDIRTEYIKKHPYGFHIHTPSSAVPKDGPSAGCAFAIAFISRILNQKIKHDIAITGEIELTGKVTKIGGLQYKLPGAKRAGVKLVLVSSENKDDIETLKKEYPDLFDSQFEVKLVENLKEVLEYVLVDLDTNMII